MFSCGTIGDDDGGGGDNDADDNDLLLGLPTGAIAATFASVNRVTVLLLILLFVVAICCCCFGVAAASVPAIGFVVVVCCGVVAVDDTAVVFAADDVAFDKSGFNVFGIPQIFDSVVLTGLSFDDGLLGSHIAAICSVDNIVLLPSDSAGDGDGGWVVDADSGDDGEDECCA